MFKSPILNKQQNPSKKKKNCSSITRITSLLLLYYTKKLQYEYMLITDFSVNIDSGAEPLCIPHQNILTLSFFTLPQKIQALSGSLSCTSYQL